MGRLFFTNSLIDDYEDNQQIDNEIAASILSWPGRGNVEAANDSLLIELPNQELAPFFDRNENGTYEPRLGEYPIIAEEFAEVIPDELLWCIFNDIGNIHSASQGDPIGIEVALTVWGFDCDNDVLDQTLFTRHIVRHKGRNKITNAGIGLWMDGEIGCTRDDYVGCDTTLNTFYFYNGDNQDGVLGSNCRGGSGSPFGENPPVQTITYLNQEMQSFGSILNRTVGNPTSGMTDPTSPIHYWRYLTGKWRDGQPFTFGGNGYMDGDTTKILFTGNPNDSTAWSMYSENLPATDARTISTLQIPEWRKGMTTVIDMAYSFHRQEGFDHIENVNYALERTASVLEHYQEGFTSISCPRRIPCEEDCVYPGDVNNDGIVNELDILAVGIGIGKQATGAARQASTAEWLPQNAIDWVDTTKNGTNFKHLDADGNGQLNLTDYEVIKHHFGKVNSDFPEIEYSPIVDSSDATVRLKVNIPRDTRSFGGNWVRRLLFVNITLEIDTLSSGIHGLLGKVVFSPQFLGALNSDGTPDRSNELKEVSFFGDNEHIQIVDFDILKGELYFLMSKIDLESAKGKDDILIFWIITRDDFTTPNIDGIQSIDISLDEVLAIDANEQILPVSLQKDSIIITEVPFRNFLEDINEVERNETGLLEKMMIGLQPNPSRGELNINFREDVVEQSARIVIYDNKGQICLESQTALLTNISINLPSTSKNGMYFLKVITDSAIETSSFILLR